MSTYIKIQQGTARGDADLCVSCRNCAIRRGTDGLEQRTCSAIGGFDRSGWGTLTQRVASCSFYSNANLPSLSMLMEIAWALSPPSSKGRMGFTTPEDR